MPLTSMFRKSGKKKNDDGNFVGVTLFGNDLDSVAGHSAQPDPAATAAAAAAPGSPSPFPMAQRGRLFSEYIDDETADSMTSPTGNLGGKTFGMALSSLPPSAFVKIRHLTVPKVLHYLVTWLQQHDVHSTEGVFRKPGRKSRIKAAMEVVESGRQIEEDGLLSEDIRAHDIATLLAEYLNMLPEALLESRRDQFIDAMAEPSKRLQAMELRKAYLLLPKLNQDSTSYLLEFLSELAASAEVTKTTSANMAVCFEAALFNKVDLQQLSAQQRCLHGEQRVSLITAIEILITRAEHFH